MASSVHVDGLSKFTGSVEELKLKIDAAGLSFVTLGGQLIADAAKGEFAGGDHTYPWQGPNFPRPTSHSGFLRDSIRVDRVYRAESGVWASDTGPTTVYGRRIELGYLGQGHWPYYTTRPFPFLKPGEEKSRPFVAALFEKLIATAQEA